MAIAKGIGGGFPLGACLGTAEAAKGMTIGTHGSTYGGNPLATALGNAVLDVTLAPGFLDHVRRIGLLFKQRLAELKDRHPAVIAEVRGEGLLIGLRSHRAECEAGRRHARRKNTGARSRGQCRSAAAAADRRRSGDQRSDGAP